jgi:hypothetical protein
MVRGPGTAPEAVCAPLPRGGERGIVAQKVGNHRYVLAIFSGFRRARGSVIVEMSVTGADPLDNTRRLRDSLGRYVRHDVS